MRPYYVDTNSSAHAEPDCKYCVKKKLPSGASIIIAHIPDYHENPKGVAAGLAEILNRERNIVLPTIKL